MYLFSIHIAWQIWTNQAMWTFGVDFLESSYRGSQPRIFHPFHNCFFLGIGRHLSFSVKASVFDFKCFLYDDIRWGQVWQLDFILLVWYSFTVLEERKDKARDDYLDKILSLWHHLTTKVFSKNENIYSFLKVNQWMWITSIIQKQLLLYWY